MIRNLSVLLQRNSGGGPTVPQIVGRLLDLFPQSGERVVGKTSVGKWASSLPDEVSEVLTQHGGLAKFASANPNFFHVSKENGTLTVSLTSLSTGLLQQKKFKEAQRLEKANEKRRSFSGDRRRF
mmetsp:Transcript_8834/g.9944  ORF Transcript_8834/g.9944 Transcript_8834/m.9944 type:complete len:125 (-) Transcript_8834:70-444(-)